jgi:hypothetical protein
MKTPLACTDPPDTRRPRPIREVAQVPAYALDLLDQLTEAQKLVLMLAGGNQELREKLITVADQHRSLLRNAILRGLS